MPAGNTSSPQRRPGSASALWLLFGPTVWAIHFTLLYGAHTLLCAVGGAGASRTVSIVVIVATLAALVLLAIPCVRGRLPSRQPPSDSATVTRFVRRTTFWLLILSAVAVIWAGATSLVVTGCPAPQ